MINFMTTRLLRKSALIVCLALLSSPAMAEETMPGQGETMDMPAVSQTVEVENVKETHPILRLSQDKSEMIKLNKEAASVIVGNPNHISVLLDTPDTIIVVPRANGASHFSVIGKDGTVLMQRHVVVGAAKEQYVRIRRSCGANDRGCQPTSVYFCPDMCHEVSGNAEGSGSGGSFSFNF